MTLESMQRTVDPAALWPMGEEWDWHTGNVQGVFHNLRFFTPPLYARYGNASSAADYLQRAQVALYEGHRAFFEGYTRNKYTSTGLIQWMLNNAWPENIWHLYDFYLGAGGSFYGTRKACEDVHAIYSYSDRSVWVVNSRYVAYADFTLTVSLRNVTGELVWSTAARVPSLCADCTANILTLPAPAAATTTTTYFLRLQLSGGSLVAPAINDYWLSTKPDVLDWAASTFYTTLCKSFGDLTALQHLPPVTLQLAATPLGPAAYNVSITNPTPTVAFFVRLRAQAAGEEVVPALWDDNYLVLFSQETRAVTVTFPTLTIGPAAAPITFSYEVFNNISGKRV